MATPLFSKQVKYKIEYENMDIFTNYETIRWKQIVNSLDRDSEQYKKYADVFSKRKTIVAKIAKRTKFLREVLKLLKYKYDTAPMAP